MCVSIFCAIVDYAYLGNKVVVEYPHVSLERPSIAIGFVYRVAIEFISLLLIGMKVVV